MSGLLFSGATRTTWRRVGLGGRAANRTVERGLAEGASSAAFLAAASNDDNSLPV